MTLKQIRAELERITGKSWASVEKMSKAKAADLLRKHTVDKEPEVKKLPTRSRVLKERDRKKAERAARKPEDIDEKPRRRARRTVDAGPNVNAPGWRIKEKDMSVADWAREEGHNPRDVRMALRKSELTKGEITWDQLNKAFPAASQGGTSGGGRLKSSSKKTTRK